jgi:phenylpropionate dioxygenase-like ring-hydroxylating dioxygenase large terminal subunit
METAHSIGLARRAEQESQRDGFPLDFPNPIDVPASRYTDPDFFALERSRVLEQSWLFAAHADQLPEPGDYLMLDAFELLGHPIFLVRGRDGVIRALYNSCRHRGGPLVDRPSGSTGRTLVCKYHSWSYDLDGRLLGFPEAKNFPRGAHTACPPLRRAQCDTWGPFVFVKLGEGGPGLREYLEPVATELDPLLGELAPDVHYAGLRQLDVACNWKLAGDGNIETYHVPFVHRNSAATLLDEKQTGQWLLPHGHSRMLIRFRTPFPENLPFPRFAGDTSVAELGIYSFHVFPNLSIVVGGPTSAFTITAFPDGPDRCRYLAHFLSPVARSETTERGIDASIEANWKVLLEDLACMAAAQKSMRCGAADVLRLQYQERRIRYVHEEIDRRIGAERVPAALRVPALLDDYVEER